jgi:hypothetical protein
MSSTFSMLRSSSSSPLNAEIEIGVVCMFSSR